MFRETIEKYYPEMKAIREDIHRHPELSYKEERTCALIMEKLKEYGVDEIKQVFRTGVVALIRGTAGEGKCVAFRADIDALPVTEETGVEYASENPGVMHACGHDIHTTALLTVARVLCENRDKLRGTVKLIFQPAEEGANPNDTSGGASHMVEEGCMENPHVDAIFGLHVQPSTADKAGSVGIKKGVTSSGFDIYRFSVHGRTAHGSQPQKGNDAILALAQFITTLQQVVSRNIDPLKTAILTIGTISGGSVVNIIPDEAEAAGCFRFYDNESAEVIRQHTCDIAKGVELISGCKIDIDLKHGYACVVNDDHLTDLADAVICESFGEDKRLVVTEPGSGSEDFSAFQLMTDTPGSYLWLNVEALTDSFVLHNSRCILSSEGIKDAAEIFCGIAVKYLSE